MPCPDAIQPHSWRYYGVTSNTTPSPFDPPIDKAGNLYGTTQAGGTKNSGTVLQAESCNEGQKEGELGRRRSYIPSKAKKMARCLSRR
jgi:hypothetical protein